MRKPTVVAITAAAALAVAAPAQARSSSIQCQPLPSAWGGLCSSVTSVRHAQLSGTGKFVLGLPGGWEATARQVGYRDWQAYVVAPWPVSGRAYVRSLSCCTITFWGGQAW